MNARRTVTLDLETGKWDGTLTYPEQLRLAASLLPGMTESLLDGWYSTWMSNDPPANAEPARHIVELRIIVDTREAAEGIAAQLHATLADRKTEPLVALAPMPREAGPRTDSIAIHPQSIRLYRDGMKLPHHTKEN